MKKGVTKMGNRISAWILTLVMIVGLVAVPAKEVKAAAQEWNLSVKSGTSNTSVDIAKNAYGDDYIGDVPFEVPAVAASKSALSSNGITSMEVTLTVNSFTKGTGKDPVAMLYAQPGEDGTWAWNQSNDEKLVTGTQITLTYDFSGMDWNNGSTMGNLGIRFANCADGSKVTFTIDSAKLIGGGSTGGSGSEGSGGATSDEVTAKVTKLSGNSDWAEYNYSVTNGTDSPISGIQIKIPASGSVNSLQSWNCSASYSGGYIIVSHSAVLQAGATYTCDSDTKFGFAGGAALGTPIVEFVYGEDGGGTSSSALNYELTGKTKEVAFADTPVGKHGKLSLKEVDGYKTPVIVDENGKPFQLRGASTHGIQWDEMRPYVNEGSFQSLRDEWGVNMVRLACYVTQGGYTAGKKDSMDSTIQTGVEAAKKLGMYIIIDWHIHEENPHTTKSQAQEFFKTYATKYKDYDNVIFEICNEPTGVSWYNNGSGDLYSYCKDIATIIRDCGSNALIVCGTNTWSQDVDDVVKKPLKDDGFENILYTFHFYSGSHYEDKMNKVRTALAAGTPIFVTEFGICDASGNGGFDTANADKWIELCDANNISYACWSLCNKNESASYLKPSSTKTTGGWTEDDLATTGIWLVNTYRAHQDKEEGTDTSKGELSLSIDPESGQLEDVGEGYTDPGKFVITVTNTGDKEVTDLSAKLARGNAFKISKALSKTTLNSGESTTLEVSLSSGQKAGTYGDTVTVQSGTMKKTVNIKQVVSEKAVSVTGVTVSPTKISLVKGKTQTLTATVSPEDATNKKVTWSSANSKVATVSTSGVVTAVASGTTTITVKTADGGKTAECEVTVTNPLTDFELQEALALSVGETYKLKTTPTPSDADAYTVVWSSQDSAIASVSEDGTVTAKGKGTTTITAKVGTITKTCKVTVTVPLTGIHFEPAELKLEKGDTQSLTVVPEPEGAILNEDITYESSDTKVATVSKDGIVTAIKTGTAKITAKLGNANIKPAECTVTVTTPVTGIEILESLELELNEEYDLSDKVQILPEDADNKAVTWKSSDNSKVTVSETGEVKAIATTAIDTPVIITVTTEDGGYQAECQVSVVGVKVTGITIEKSTLSVNVLETVDLIKELNPTVSPENASNPTITWTSSNPDMASVTREGELTAHKGGEEPVTITAKAGNFTAICKVTIIKKEQKLNSVTIYRESRTFDSITIGCSDKNGIGEGGLEFSADGKEWFPLADDSTVTLGGLKEFTGYKIKARLASNDIYNESNIWEDTNVIYTLVKNPYNVDVSKLGDSNYLDALREADDKEPTVSFEDNELTLSEKKPKEYTITGKNEDVTIITKEGDYDITLKDTTIKSVDVSASDEVDIHIVGNVTIKEGIVSSSDTDIVITGENRQGTLNTPSVRTEGSVTITDVTVNADASESEPAGPAISGENVTITDATVNATGGDGSPAIEAEDKVTITDSDVNAKAGKGAPAIEGKEVELDNSNVDLETESGQKGVVADKIVVDNTDVVYNGDANADLEDIYSETPVDKSGNPLKKKQPKELVEKISISVPTTLEVGDRVRATVTVTPKGANDEVTWTSNNTNVLDVDKDGYVRALAVGTATIIATATDGSGVNGKATITVNDSDTGEGDDHIEATSLKLTASVKGASNIPVSSTMKLAPKKTMTLDVEFLPENAEEEDLTFTSSNTKIVKVNKNGKITAGSKAGKATITVESESGLKKTFKVQVMKKAVSKVKIKASKTTIKVKKTVKLKATLTPNKKQASNNVFWKSSKPTIATVSSKGVVKGLKKGKAKITAIATDGSGKKATVTIQVK